MLKRLLSIILLSSVMLAACVNASPPEDNVPTLTITDGVASKTYTTADLQKLEQVQVEDNGIIYLGVPLFVLLYDSGFDPLTVFTVDAIASDKFIASYDQTLIQKPDTVLAYAVLNGSLSEDEGPFRMVLPEEVGKLNPRMVVKLLITRP